MQLTPNFSLKEFRQHSYHGFGAVDVPTDYRPNIKDLCIHVLQPVRDKIQRPITITSGYRSPAYNRAVGGVWGSQHCWGRAADITTAGIPPTRLARIILDMYNADDIPLLGGLGTYKTFVHVDIRPKRNNRLARWGLKL